MTPLPPPERVAAVVVAAGRGERLGAPEKVLLPLAGRPMLAWSLRALERAETIGSVVVVAGSHTLDAVGQLVRDEGFAKVHAIVAGGERRQDSVGAGLAALPEGIEIVVIHDGARPLAEPELFDRCAAAAAESGAAIAATPVADTLKRVAEGVSRGRSIAPGCGPRRRRRHSASNRCAGRWLPAPGRPSPTRRVFARLPVCRCRSSPPPRRT